MNVSVIIPYRYKDPWRETLFQFVYSRLYLQWPDFEICVGDSPGPEFSRSAARNAAAREAKGDLFLICDADTIANVDAISDALRFASEHNTWAHPYSMYYNLTTQTTEYIVRHSADARIERPIKWEHALDYVISGMIVVPRWAFEKVGGFDERFIGYGWEDNAFAYALTALVGPIRRSEGFVAHLWHPVDNGDPFDHPHKEENRQLAARYERCLRSPDDMERLIHERAG